MSKRDAPRCVCLGLWCCRAFRVVRGGFLELKHLDLRQGMGILRPRNASETVRMQGGAVV
jgi:hypothetical protein